MLFLGRIALARGSSSEGCTYYEEARAHAQRIGDDPSLVFALCGLGDAALADRDLDGARSAYRQALEIAAVDLRPRPGWWVIACLAGLAAHQGRLERAISLIATVQKAAEEPLPPAIDDLGFWLDLRQRAASLLTELERRLPPAAFIAAQERGRSMTLRAAVAELRAELGE